MFGERRVIYLFNKYDKSVLIFELDLTLKMQEPQWRSGWSYNYMKFVTSLILSMS